MLFRSPVLRVMADGVPMLLDAAEAIQAWADRSAQPGATPERVLGKHKTRYRGVDVEVGTRPYTLFMIQRALGAYRTLTEPERERVDDALRGLIHDGKGESEMLTHARRRSGSIVRSGVEKVLNGVTSIEEVLRVTREV